MLPARLATETYAVSQLIREALLVTFFFCFFFVQTSRQKNAMRGGCGWWVWEKMKEQCQKKKKKKYIYNKKKKKKKKGIRTKEKKKKRKKKKKPNDTPERKATSITGINDNCSVIKYQYLQHTYTNKMGASTRPGRQKCSIRIGCDKHR
jgi:hypothetical protein